MKSFAQYITERQECQVYTPSQIKDLEKFADRLLNKYDVDIDFTRHFRDRMNDNRNRPCIQIAELQKLFQKMERFHGKRIKGHGEGQAVILDMQKDLNMPVVIDLKRGKFEVRAKTIMRKKNFKSPDKKIIYEDKIPKKYLSATLSKDPENYGATMEVDDTKKFKKEKISLQKTKGFEPDSKMRSKVSKRKVNRIRQALDKGHDVGNIYVRKRKGGGHEVLDGHHRVHAHRQRGDKHVHAVVVPHENINEKI